LRPRAATRRNSARLVRRPGLFAFAPAMPKP
jgi:hypothetical protein